MATGPKYPTYQKRNHAPLPFTILEISELPIELLFKPLIQPQLNSIHTNLCNILTTRYEFSTQ